MEFGFYPPDELPSQFDIVWVRFPERERPGEPGPKIRPALVLDAMFHPATGRPWVLAAYGGSRGFDQRNPFHFVIGNLRDLDHCGLDFMTRFDLNRKESLPFCRQYFWPPPGKQTLTIGHLSPRIQTRLIARNRDLMLLATATTLVRNGRLRAIRNENEQQIRAPKPPVMIRYLRRVWPQGFGRGDAE